MHEYLGPEYKNNKHAMKEQIVCIIYKYLVYTLSLTFLTFWLLFDFNNLLILKRKSSLSGVVQVPLHSHKWHSW